MSDAFVIGFDVDCSHCSSWMFLSAENRTVQNLLKKSEISFSFVPDFRGKSMDSFISVFFTVS